VVAAALFVGACGGGSSSHDHAKSSGTVAGARTVEVSAKSFEFTPKEITVKAGEPVTIALKAQDILHDFTIDNPKVHVAASPGETGTGGLMIDKPGRYTFYCSVAGHRAAGMEGTVVVE
jgi:uncharacterized cupredoxin-like copper-binding protein